ncbi:uncharacterized protein [Bemisia tabaci]|uniref:uncharacterized protein n=1 Tax=Bemisia tabaci TaxID=7038 RepID=UPI003B27C8EF
MDFDTKSNPPSGSGVPTPPQQASDSYSRIVSHSSDDEIFLNVNESASSQMETSRCVFVAPPASNLRTPLLIRDVRGTATLSRSIFNHSYEKWAIVEAEVLRLTPLGRRWACMLISVEISTRKRVFRVIERKDRFFADIISDIPRNRFYAYYECITTAVKSVKLYFDVEWSATEVTFKDMAFASVTLLMQCWNDYIKELCPSLVHEVADFEYLESHNAPVESTIVEGGCKISFHIISLKKVYFLNMPAIRKCVTGFYTQLESRRGSDTSGTISKALFPNGKCILDISVYKSRQNFRLPLCSKVQEPHRIMRFVSGNPSPIRCIKALCHPTSRTPSDVSISECAIDQWRIPCFRPPRPTVNEQPAAPTIVDPRGGRGNVGVCAPTVQSSSHVEGLMWERVKGACGDAGAPLAPSIGMRLEPFSGREMEHLIDDRHRVIDSAPMHSFDPTTSTGRSSRFINPPEANTSNDASMPPRNKRENRPVYTCVEVSPIGNDADLTAAVFTCVDRNLIYKVNASPYHGNECAEKCADNGTTELVSKRRNFFRHQVL